MKLIAMLAAAILLSACASSTPSASPTRAGLVTARGKPLTLEGRPAKVGDPAPDFTAVANDMTEKRLSDFRGQTVILSTVPSLETAVCDMETRTFNEKAATLPQDTIILTISMDLPFTQKRWCGAAGIDRVITLSDSKLRQVGDRYGLRVQETGLLARAVTVIDAQGVIRYQQIVPEITSEPDYNAALAAAQAAR